MKFVSAQSRSLLSRSVVLITMIVLASESHAQDPEVLVDAKVIVSRNIVDLPPFHEIADRPLINFYATESDYREARGDSRYIYERLTYLSDGIEVVGYFYRRADANGAQPTIVFNRGSYIRNDTAPE